MTDVKIAKVSIVDVDLGKLTLSNKKINTHYGLCKSYKPTNAEVKCFLQSNLVNINTVKSIFFKYSNYDLQGIFMDIKFNLDSEYTFLDSDFINVKDLGRTVHLAAEANWIIDSNQIEGFTLISGKVKNSNSVEVSIPPASCFNLTIQETLTSYNIAYTATAQMHIYESSGEQIVGSELSVLARALANNQAYETTTRSIKLPLTGEIIVNVIGSDYSQVMPCDNNIEIGSFL